MTNIESIGGLASTATLREFADQSARRSGGEGATAVLDDRVEISDLANMLSRLADLPDHRARKIVAVRGAIQDGSYVTPDKLEVAASRLLDDISNKSA